jgi:hypothetical protein
VTTSQGACATLPVVVKDGVFRCVYPEDFKDAPPLTACMLFIDATADSAFDTSRTGYSQAEAAVIVYDSRKRLVPDLPSAFTNDLLDGKGRTDQRCAEWPTVRTLINLYMHSQAARMVRKGRMDFDLAKPDDFTWFKSNLTLHDFDYRDRDWSKPLGHRVRRTFWQSVWNTWFNWTNDNPLDGNPANRSQSNYMPYAFANDFSDELIMYLMRLRNVEPLDDNLRAMCREGAENMMAMQHREATNFALLDWRGKQETYTTGAFRYGMFKNGVYMTEKTGWLNNPRSLDYINGGVLNGRAMWAMFLPHGRPGWPALRPAGLGEKDCRRAEAMISYLCGYNPWGVRLFNETGGVYNWVDDTDRDGSEDYLKYDMYPESTAFCQIGTMHLLRTLSGN